MPHDGERISELKDKKINKKSGESVLNIMKDVSKRPRMVLGPLIPDSRSNAD